MQQARQNTAGRQRPAPPANGRARASSAQPRKKPAAKRTVQSKRAKKEKDPNRIRFWSIEGRADVPMLIITLVLLVFGITMMFSAGHAWSYTENDGDSYAYVVKQMIAAGLGLVGMFFLTLFDYRFLRHEIKLFGTKRSFTAAHLLLIFTMALNLLTIPFGVKAAGGQKRWLQIPVLGQFQPSDFLKVAVIIFMAYYIHKNSPVIRKFFYGLFKPGLLFLAIIVVILSQKHLSCLMIIFMVCAVMLFVGGVNIKPAVGVFVAALVVIAAALQFTGADYFGDRIKYMDPLSDIGNHSYQNYEAALAVGSGGFWGKGFGNSSQKYYYLPEAQNDFVYAILVEEFGFVGGFAVILMFLIFVFRGFYIARRAEDKFGCLLATGITFQIGLQAFLNLGVNLCCIPNTGISMPFFSYGGTALMIQLWEMGLLLSVSKRAKLN